MNLSNILRPDSPYNSKIEVKLQFFLWVKVRKSQKTFFDFNSSKKLAYVYPSLWNGLLTIILGAIQSAFIFFNWPIP